MGPCRGEPWYEAQQKRSGCRTPCGQRNKKRDQVAGTEKQSSPLHKGWREKPIRDAGDGAAGRQLAKADCHHRHSHGSEPECSWIEYPWGEVRLLPAQTARELCWRGCGDPGAASSSRCK